jgi:hypothetical protein
MLENGTARRTPATTLGWTTMRDAKQVLVDKIILDKTNPRIKNYLEMYEDISNEAQMLLALGAGAEEEGGNTAQASFNRLKHSIKASGGIIQPSSTVI